MADIPASNWDETDANNNTAAPDGAPEGMAPSGVNNVLRAHQGAIKRWYDWTIPKATGGSSAAYTLSYAVTPGALIDGMTHLVKFGAVNAASPTLNVNALGAAPLHFFCGGSWAALPANMLAVDQIVQVAYNSSAGAYRCIGLAPVLTQSVSAVSNIDFTAIPTNVNHLRVEFGLTPSTSDVLRFRFYNNAGTLDATSVYYSTGTISQNGTVSGIVEAAATGITLTGWAGTLPIVGTLTIADIQRAARTTMVGGAMGTNSTPGLASYAGGGFRVSNGPIKGLRIYCQAGATLTGRVTVTLLS